MRRFQILISVLISTIAISGCSRPSDRFQRADAEKAGFSLSSLDELGSFLEYSGSSALLVLQDGKVVYEWGDIYKKHTIHSIRKCLLNGLMGIYVERGLIDTNLTLSQLDIDDTNHKLTYGEKLARMADLLRSRSGVYHDAAAETASMLKNRPLKGLHEPNEAFYYNNWDFNTLGYIFEQAAGKSIFKAFYEEFAIPLGMLQYQGETSSIDEDDPDAHIPKTDGYYQYERSRSSYPAYQFRMSAHDLALYGLLFQRDGNWQGKQLISSDWISA
ncbi:MAG: serine hydrolase, partial [FCB group bacterium]|nr:serine hydrolase [FCB group bacterium]